ncbi:hypothetical protein ACWCQL_32930 [Streptomyces sp. NPDC002073]
MIDAEGRTIRQPRFSVSLDVMPDDPEDDLRKALSGLDAATDAFATAMRTYFASDPIG